jgi:hypothetical protein
MMRATKLNSNRSELRDQSEEEANLWFSVLHFVWELRGISNGFVWGARICCYAGVRKEKYKAKGNPKMMHSCSCGAVWRGSCPNLLYLINFN